MTKKQVVGSEMLMLAALLRMMPKIYFERAIEASVQSMYGGYQLVFKSIITYSVRMEY